MLGRSQRSPPSRRPALDAGLSFSSAPDKISQAPCQARGDDGDVMVFEGRCWAFAEIGFGLMDNVTGFANCAYMAQEDWYRNKTWDSDIEKVFRAKLSRARSQRPQYLLIQAGYLVERHPLVTLRLIGEYFETDDDFHIPSAFGIRAAALCKIGDVAKAVDAYKKALAWEKDHPFHITNARIDLPKLIVDHQIFREYDYALDILVNRFNESDHAFPMTRYLWNGCNAIIAKESGQIAEAQQFAESALRAAAQTESPFRYHRTVGLVPNANDEFGRHLKRIVRPSKLHTLLRLFTRKYT